MPEIENQTLPNIVKLLLDCDSLTQGEAKALRAMKLIYPEVMDAGSTWRPNTPTLKDARYIDQLAAKHIEKRIEAPPLVTWQPYPSNAAPMPLHPPYRVTCDGVPAHL